MISKETGFFEKHIEKIIFLAVCVVSVILLFYFVALGPAKIEISGRKVRISRIDDEIKALADKVKSNLDRPAVHTPPPPPKKDEFAKNTVRPFELDNGIYQPIPPNQSQSKQPAFKYNLPQLPQIELALAGKIRTTAYVPIITPDETNAYSQTGSEVNDVDIVTVEFKYDIGSLYKAFNDCFAGSKVEVQARNKELAEPIIATVQVQRQQQLEDGSWPEQWQDIPRGKVDIYSKLLEPVEDFDKLATGGLQVRLIQYKDKNVQLDLLQPDCYRIASPRDEWFPPSIYTTFRPLLDKELTKQKREFEKAEANRKKLLAAAKLTGADATLAAASAAAIPSAAGLNVLESTVFNQVYKDFSSIIITEKTDLSKMKEPITIWAFDDTVQPLKTYRYRVRLGVFNPIAGTDQFADADNPNKNKVILWTNFAEAKTDSDEPRNTITIPARMYFFAHSIDESRKSVGVWVSRYKLDYWYIKDFIVLPGDTIGRLEQTASDNEETEVDNIGAALLQTITSNPKQIDYTTGQTMLDVIPISEWAGSSNLYARNFYQMLYSSDGFSILQVPIGDRNWPPYISEQWRFVKANETTLDTPKEPFRQFASGKERIKQRTEQKQTTTPTTPALGGIDTALLELMLKRQPGATIPE